MRTALRPPQRTAIRACNRRNEHGTCSRCGNESIEPRSRNERAGTAHQNRRRGRHEMFRAGVIATLQPHFDVVGQAADVEGSVAMIAQTKPDVVLLDVHVPGGEGGGGTEILTKSRAYSPDTVFLALSVSDSPQDVGSVIRAGAAGICDEATISGDDLVSSHQAGA